LKINYFCAQNYENYIYSCVKLHKKIAATRAALFDSNNAPNRLSAGALPQTPLGELTVISQTPYLYLGGHF